MKIDCPVCGQTQPREARRCGQCGTEYTLVNLTSAYAEKARLRLPQTSDGRVGIKCVRCENVVPRRAHSCPECQLEFSVVNVLRVLLIRLAFRLGLLPMKPVNATRYSICMSVLLGAALLFGPAWLLRNFDLGSIAIGFIHGVSLMVFFVSLFIWVAGREFVSRVFVESPAAARIGHFCALAFVFAGLWLIAMFVPIPTTTLLLILAGLWAALFLFIRFVWPFIREILAFLGSGGPPPSGFDPAGPQGRDVKMD